MRPAVRVTWTRQLIATLDDASGAREAVLGGVSRETSAAVAEAKRIGWIDLGAHMEVCESIRAVLGPEGCRRHFCATTVRSGRGTLFGPLVDGFVSLFGPSPVSTVRASPRAWAFIFRGVGKLEIGDAEGTSIRASITELESSLRTTTTFAIGVHGALDACLEFVHRSGTVSMDTQRLGAGRVEYELRWTED
ncbi:MAG: hypothetical protein AAF721_02815 [Myxococcota bacterium]